MTKRKIKKRKKKKRTIIMSHLLPKKKEGIPAAAMGIQTRIKVLMRMMPQLAWQLKE